MRIAIFDEVLNDRIPVVIYYGEAFAPDIMDMCNKVSRGQGRLILESDGKSVTGITMKYEPYVKEGKAE